MKREENWVKLIGSQDIRRWVDGEKELGVDGSGKQRRRLEREGVFRCFFEVDFDGRVF